LKLGNLQQAISNIQNGRNVNTRIQLLALHNLELAFSKRNIHEMIRNKRK
jgi:hypothetical protein